MGIIYRAAKAIGRVRENPEGSFDVLAINKTGTISEKGTIVSIDPVTPSGVIISVAQSLSVHLIVQDSGYPDGEWIWCTLFGRCQVLLADSTSTARNNWVRSHATIDGRADGTLAQMPDEGNPEVFPTSTRKHLFGLGRALENVTAGTGKLAWILMRQS